MATLSVLDEQNQNAYSKKSGTQSLSFAENDSSQPYSLSLAESLLKSDPVHFLLPRTGSLLIRCCATVLVVIRLL